MGYWSFWAPWTARTRIGMTIWRGPISSELLGVPVAVRPRPGGKRAWRGKRACAGQAGRSSAARCAAVRSTAVHSTAVCRIRQTGSAAMTARHALYVALLLVCLPALGAEPAVPAPPTGVAWSSLSPPQQQALGHFQGQWNSLPPERQQALATGAQRWLSMTPQQRGDARERFQAWQQLPPEQRALIRQRWRHFQQLSPQQQQAVRQNFRAFSHLPPMQRAQLRQRWLNATPQQRSQMLQQQRALRFQRGGQREPSERLPRGR